MNEFRCIVADPPWAETGGGRICRGAQKHYAVVKDGDIASLIKTSSLWAPAPACHLWLWVTNNRLPLGLSVMAELGFVYKTNLVWSKDRFGIGQYLRGQHELCLLGSRGATKYPDIRNVPSVVHAPRTKHSKKPQAAFDVIERVSAGPRLELFARELRPGWTVWGDEVESTNKDHQ